VQYLSNVDQIVLMDNVSISVFFIFMLLDSIVVH